MIIATSSNSDMLDMMQFRPVFNVSLTMPMLAQPEEIVAGVSDLFLFPLLPFGSPGFIDYADVSFFSVPCSRCQSE